MQRSGAAIPYGQVGPPPFLSSLHRERKTIPIFLLLSNFSSRTQISFSRRCLQETFQASGHCKGTTAGVEAEAGAGAGTCGHGHAHPKARTHARTHSAQVPDTVPVCKQLLAHQLGLIFLLLSNFSSRTQISFSRRCLQETFQASGHCKGTTAGVEAEAGAGAGTCGHGHAHPKARTQIAHVHCERVIPCAVFEQHISQPRFK